MSMRLSNHASIVSKQLGSVGRLVGNSELRRDVARVAEH